MGAELFIYVGTIFTAIGTIALAADHQLEVRGEARRRRKARQRVREARG